MKPFRASFALLLALALALPALAAPCMGMEPAAMAEACPLMQAMGEDCGMPADAGDGGPRWDRPTPNCCIVSGGEPAAAPGVLISLQPDPQALRPAIGPEAATLRAVTEQPAPASSPPRASLTPLFTLHASLLI